MIENCKVNFDGSNYLAKLPQPCPFKKGKPKKFLKTIEIPADTQATTTCENPQDNICDEVVKYAEKARAENDGKEKKKAQTKKIVVDLKEIFNTLFLANAGKTYNEKKNAIIDGLRPYFDDFQGLIAFVDMQLERVRHNQGQRNARLWKKLNNVPFNYFITVTYDSKKHTEEAFRKAFTNFLKHVVYRKNWRYIGVWERGNATERLHFHALVYIPDGQMIGELFEQRDYSTKQKRMQTTIQNTHFNEKFGRTDFEVITTDNHLTEYYYYLKKYMEKSGEKLIVSRNCPTHFNLSVFKDDMICPLENNEYKHILADDFKGVNADGEIIENITREKLLKLADEKRI